MRSPTEPSLWTEENWIEHLHEWATMLTPDAHTAADLAMECLYAFYRHFQHFPWQHPDPHHALCWCRHKLRSLTIDRTRHEQCLVQVAWETLPEGVACAAMDERLQNEFDAQAFLDSLPEGLREVLQLRLEGYSWEEVGRLLGRNANTLRSYLPDLRKKFIEFFGYDPSKRASESFIRVEAANASEDGGRDDEGTSGTEKGFTHDTESAGGVVALRFVGGWMVAVFAPCSWDVEDAC
ncbi:MAG: sigma-70 family RNA polymerase sigma factor [Fimbriimonadales bacterium]